MYLAQQIIIDIVNKLIIKQTYLKESSRTIKQAFHSKMRNFEKFNFLVIVLPWQRFNIFIQIKY